MSKATRIYPIALSFSMVLSVGLWQACHPAEKTWSVQWRDGSVNRQEYLEWLEYIDLVDSDTAIKEMVLVQHLAQEAKRKGIDQEPEFKMGLDVALQRVYGDRLRQYVFSNTQVDPTEVTRLSQQNPDAFKQPPKWKLRQIYLQTDPTHSEEQVRTRLAEMREQVLQGADFEGLALQYSQSQTRFTGGRLGWVDLNQFPADLQEGIRPLKAGELSEIVATGRGWSFFLCEEIRPGQNPTPEEREAKIRTNLHRQESRLAWQKMAQSLRENIDLPEDLDVHADPIRVDGWELTQGEWAALKALQSQQTGSDEINLMEARRLLSNWCLGKRMMAEVKALGFDQEKKMANTLKWLPLTRLAYEELQRRVKDQEKPVTQEDLRIFFETDRGKLTHPPEWQFRVIYFGKDMGDGTRVTLAEKVESQLAAGSLSFEDAARQYSQDESAAEGGLWPMLPMREFSNISSTFAKAARLMQPGERSGLLRLENGIWLLELVAKNPQRPMTFEEAQGRIEELVLNQQRQELEINTRRSIQDSLDIRIPTRAKKA